MKKILALSISILTALSLTACYSSSQSSASSDSNDHSPTHVTTAKEEKKLFEITIGEAETGYDDYVGGNYLAVKFTVENLSDTSEPFYPTYEAKAFQNGVECEKVYFMKTEKYDSSNSLEIQPGAAYTFYEVFKPQDSSSITVSAEPLMPKFGYDCEAVSKEFTLS